MKIAMEDWLRGCICHDSKHGFVTLPVDKVREIANFIQLTRITLSDGFIEVSSDESQTESMSGQDCPWK